MDKPCDKPVELELRSRLETLNPEWLAIENESINHAGYFPGKESHFKVTIVGDIFTGKSRIKRHQLVYGCADELLGVNGGIIHALAIHAYTPEQWTESGQKIPNSPKCAGKNI